LEFVQFLQQALVIGHSFHDEADDPLPVDQIGNASALKKPAYLTGRIIDQRKGYSVFLAELLVGLDGIAADAQNLSVALAKGFQIPLESDQFVASDRGEISKVEGEDDILSTQGGKSDRSPGRFPGEVGGRGADFQGVSREARQGDPCGSEQPSKQSFHGVLPWCSLRESLRHRRRCASARRFPRPCCQPP
jgi:hypothetical protein